jgi:nitrilase
MILGPTGEAISDVLSGHEGILYGEIDIAHAVEQKQFHDVVGYYNRFDIFRLEVDRTPRDPAAFLEAEPIDTLAQPPPATNRTPPANGGKPTG